MEWFRWYHNTVEDGKFRLVARQASVKLRDVIAVWALILEGASQNTNRGELKFDQDYIASVLDFSDEEISAIFSALKKVGLLEFESENKFVTNWDKRQFDDPTNALRQKRYRERKKDENATISNVTHNGSVTDNNVTHNGSVTPQIQITDPDHRSQITEKQDIYIKSSSSNLNDDDDEKYFQSLPETRQNALKSAIGKAGLYLTTTAKNPNLEQPGEFVGVIRQLFLRASRASPNRSPSELLKIWCDTCDIAIKQKARKKTYYEKTFLNRVQEK